MLRRIRRLGLGAALMLASIAGAASAQTFVAKIGKIGGDADTPENLALLRYEQIVDQRTGGAVDLQIFLGGQLGDDVAIIEGMRLGSVEGGLSTAGAFSTWVPQGDFWALPFLFASADELLAAIQGKPGEILKQYYKDQGFHVVALWPAGARNPVGRYAFTSLDEVKGKKVRVIQSQLALDMWRALGANPTPMPWPEVANAIETGAIDAFDTLGSAWHGMKLYETAPIYTRLDQTWVVYVMAFSEQWWSSLPEEYQTILTEAAEEMAVFQHHYLDYFNNRGPQLAGQAGGQVVVVEEKQPFIDAMGDVWSRWSTKIEGGKELIDAALAMKK